MSTLCRRLLRLEAVEGGAVPIVGLLFLPAGVEAGTPEADRLAAEHRERTRCAVVVALSTADAAL